MASMQIEFLLETKYPYFPIKAAIGYLQAGKKRIKRRYGARSLYLLTERDFVRQA